MADKCVRMLQAIRPPPLHNSKRSLLDLANAIVKHLGRKTQKLRKRPDTDRVCRPPSGFDIKRLEPLAAMKITRAGHNRGRTRLLWTDWQRGIQSVACLMADMLNETGGAYAIEQTYMVNRFLNLCGDWREESAAFRQYLKTSTRAQVDYVRKHVWDGFSVKFAEDATMPNTVICMPVGDGVSVDMNKTLVQLELPNLNTRRYCVIGYDMRKNTVVVNPHLPTRVSRDVKVAAGQTLHLCFLPWNRQSYNAIVQYASVA